MRHLWSLEIKKEFHVKFKDKNNIFAKYLFIIDSQEMALENNIYCQLEKKKKNAVFWN